MDDEPHQLTPAQLQAMNSEPRRQIVEALASGEAHSIREIASRTGQSATKLYRHIARLLEVGLVLESGRRASRRRPEATYALIARRLSSVEASRSQAGRAAFASLARRYAVGTARALSQAVADGRASTSGERSNAACGHLVLKLDRERLHSLQQAIVRLLRDAQAQADASEPATAEMLELTILLSPAARPRRPRPEPEER